jgi:phosphonate transport system substrate-binding protein
MTVTRRRTLGWATGLLVARHAAAQQARSFRLGLTPVFLDNDAEILIRLRQALAEPMGVDIELVQRRTYEEVTGMLLEGAIDAAWTCGYPYVQHEDEFSLIGVPVWRGQPMYRSYLITAPEDTARGLPDLEGDVHAFSDPNSNSGYLVTASDLARAGLRVDKFFGRTLFTYGHRNVVRAVASGLARSGSVDGYVWEALAVVEPDLTARTKVVAQSELLGFPPFVARTDRASESGISAFGVALRGMTNSLAGRKALELLQLDDVAQEDPRIFDGIRQRMRDLAAAK